MHKTNVGLTGRTRYRASKLPWSTKLILQVEEGYQNYDHRGGGSFSPPRRRWRDARPEDITELEGTD